MHKTFPQRNKSIANVPVLVVTGMIWWLCGGAAWSAPEDGLIAFYSFDGQEPVLDCSGEGRDAVAEGPVVLVVGKRADGIKLTGGTTLVADSFDGFTWGRNLTVSLWFEWMGSTHARDGLLMAGSPEDSSWQMRLVKTEFGPGVGIVLHPASLSFPAQVFPTIPVSTGEWNHLAFVYDGQSCVVYWNGSQIKTSMPVSGELVSKFRPLVVGDQFNGNLDEIRIYQRALTSDEVRQLRRDEPGRPAAPCIEKQKVETQVQDTEAMTITRQQREAAQLEAVCCRVLDTWVDLYRNEKREALADAWTTTSRRTLLWDALIELSDPELAVPEAVIKASPDGSVSTPCTDQVETLLRIWKMGEQLFVYEEIKKLAEKKSAWERGRQ